MPCEDVIAEFEEDAIDGRPGVCISIRETRGFGWSDRDYVYLNLDGALALQRELSDAVRQLESVSEDAE